MYIKKVKLNNFRNYLNQEIELGSKINVLYGDNAQGKTNIIESIYLSAMGRSYRTKKEKELINFGQEKASVEVEFEKNDREGKINIELGEKKTFFINGIKQPKLSNILGKVNIVIFTPEDIEIVKDGPQMRRKFMDIMISQLRPNYLYVLNTYLKTLEQRNTYLRQIKFENASQEMLDIWDERLATLSETIYKYRKYFLEKIDEKIKVIHKQITKSGQEDIKIKYLCNSKNKDDFLKALIEKRKIDIIKGYTTVGIHRDDFTIFINNKEVNIYGSQGQQRTAILSLKFAELEVVYDEVGEYPILLLDDFMSELDEKRRNSFLENIKENQVIITCTDKIKLSEDCIVYRIEKGSAIRE